MKLTLFPLLLSVLLLSQCFDNESGITWSPDLQDLIAADSPGSDVEDLTPNETIGPVFGGEYGFKRLLNEETVSWNAIHGATVGDRTFVGVAGTLGTVWVLDETMQRWEHLPLDTGAELKGIYVADGDNVAICGQDGLLRRHMVRTEGAEPIWFLDDASTGVTSLLNDIHGVDIRHMWAVGDAAVALSLSGDSWTLHSKTELGLSADSTASLLTVFMVSENEVYIGGEGVLIHGLDGVYTANTTDFEGYTLYDIFVANGEVWVGANNASIFHILEDGTVKRHQPNMYSQFRALWVGPSGLVLAAGYMPPPIMWRYDGNEQDLWTSESVESPMRIEDLYPDRIDPTARIQGLWGRTYEDYFLCTHTGQVIQYALHP